MDFVYNNAGECAAGSTTQAGHGKGRSHAQELSVEAAVALVSCLVWRERADGGGAVRPELQGPLAALREAARRIGKARNCGDRILLQIPWSALWLTGCSSALVLSCAWHIVI